MLFRISPLRGKAKKASRLGSFYFLAQLFSIYLNLLSVSNFAGDYFIKMGSFDAVAGVGLVFFLVIVAAYFIIAWRVYANRRPETEKLSVYVVRLALFLPLYAFLIFIGLNVPHGLVALNIPIAMFEGYSFYCFFALIVTNMGGPASTVQFFKDSGKPLICCNSCCPEDHVQYYKKATWAMVHLIVTRVVVVTLAAISTYSGSKAGLAVGALLNFVGAIILFYCLAHLLLLCKYTQYVLLITEFLNFFFHLRRQMRTFSPIVLTCMVS